MGRYYIFFAFRYVGIGVTPMPCNVFVENVYFLHMINPDLSALMYRECGCIVGNRYLRYQICVIYIL